MNGNPIKTCPVIKSTFPTISSNSEHCDHNELTFLAISRFVNAKIRASGLEFCFKGSPGRLLTTQMIRLFPFTVNVKSPSKAKKDLYEHCPTTKMERIKFSNGLIIKRMTEIILSTSSLHCSHPN